MSCVSVATASLVSSLGCGFVLSATCLRFCLYDSWQFAHPSPLRLVFFFPCFFLQQRKTESNLFLFILFSLVCQHPRGLKWSPKSFQIISISKLILHPISHKSLLQTFRKIYINRIYGNTCELLHLVFQLVLTNGTTSVDTAVSCNLTSHDVCLF